MGPGGGGPPMGPYGPPMRGPPPPPPSGGPLPPMGGGNRPPWPPVSGAVSIKKLLFMINIVYFNFEY